MYRAVDVSPHVCLRRPLVPSSSSSRYFFYLPWDSKSKCIKSNNFNQDVLEAKMEGKEPIHLGLSRSVIIRNVIGKTPLIRLQSILDDNVLIVKWAQMKTNKLWYVGVDVRAQATKKVLSAGGRPLQCHITPLISSVPGINPVTCCKPEMHVVAGDAVPVYT